jgi:putative phosphoribosyl transferase
VLRLNQAALAQMRARAELSIVPGATHLFEEPGALEQVESLATNWFLKHLATPSSAVADARRTGATPGNYAATDAA